MKKSLVASAPPSPSAQAALQAAPLGGTREEATQRLQVGMGGVLAIVFLVGLAGIIEDRLQETDAGAVPAAVATNEPASGSSSADPLVEAGIVPDLPTEPAAQQAPPAEAEREAGTAPRAGPDDASRP